MENYLNWSTKDLRIKLNLLEENASVDDMYDDATTPIAVEMNLIKDILFKRRMEEKPLSKMSLLELAKEYADAYYTMAEGWGFSAYFAERVHPLIEEELKRRDNK